MWCWTSGCCLHTWRECFDWASVAGQKTGQRICAGMPANAVLCSAPRLREANRAARGVAAAVVLACSRPERCAVQGAASWHTSCGTRARGRCQLA